MEQKEGYKKTKIGWIPEDWDVKNLGKIGFFKNGINKGKEDFGKGIPFVNLMDVFGYSSISDKKFGLVDATIAEQKNYDLIEGDVLFIRSSVKPSGVGLTAVVGKNLENTVYSGFLIRYRENGRHFVNNFKKFCFYETKFRNRLLAKSSVSANTNINQVALSSLLISVPPLPEQQKIASILTTVDDKILSIEYQIQQTEQLKKGLMEKLLIEGIGHTEFKETKIGRIPKGWKFSTIEKACVIHNNLRKPISADERKTMRGEYPYYGPTKIVDYINEYRVEGEYALVGEDGDHFLKFRTRSMTQLASGKFNVNNHAHIIEGKDECSTKWVYHFYKNRNIIQFLTRQGAGRYKLNKASLLRMPIAVPSPKEQNDIIKILSSVDDKIEILSQKKSEYQILKKGLSQQLLTGQMRVKV